MLENTNTNPNQNNTSELQRSEKKKSLSRRVASKLGVTALGLAAFGATAEVANNVIMSNVKPDAEAGNNANRVDTQNHQAESGQVPNIVDQGETQAQMEDGTKLHITDPAAQQPAEQPPSTTQ